MADPEPEIVQSSDVACTPEEFAEIPGVKRALEDASLRLLYEFERAEHLSHDPDA